MPVRFSCPQSQARMEFTEEHVGHAPSGGGIGMHSFCLIFLMGLFSFALAVFADEIVLVDGTVIQGEVIKESSSTVKIDKGGMTLSLPRSRIKSIKKSSLNENAGQGKATGPKTDIDYLIESKQFAEAYCQLLNGSDSSRVESRETRRRIIEAWDADVSRSYVGMSEETLRKKCKDLERDMKSCTNESQELDLGRNLAHAHLRLVVYDLDHMNTGTARSRLKRVNELAPDIPGSATEYVKILSVLDREKDGYSILKPYIEIYPNDVDAIHTALQCDWTPDPWGMLEIIFPESNIQPNTSETIKSSLGDVLLACFNKEPYPSDAPFDRIECYEQYMDCEQNADPTPWVKLKLERGEDTAEALCRMAVWHSRKGEYRESAYLYGIAANSTTPGDPDIAAKHEQSVTVYQSQMDKDLQKALRANDYAHAHILASLCLYDFPPRRNEFASILIDGTSIRDKCSACLYEIAVNDKVRDYVRRNSVHPVEGRFISAHIRLAEIKGQSHVNSRLYTWASGGEAEKVPAQFV